MVQDFQNAYSEYSGFSAFIIQKRDLVKSENKPFKAVSLNIKTETERVLEAIDTIYRIDFDAIYINDMYESHEYLTVWNVEQNRFIDLFFD